MSVFIKDVILKSKADKKHIKSGDILLEINSKEINDVLDYQFYSTEAKLELKLSSGDKVYTKKIRKQEYEDIGLVFDTYLMDKKQHCKNINNVW